MASLPIKMRLLDTGWTGDAERQESSSFRAEVWAVGLLDRKQGQEGGPSPALRSDLQRAGLASLFPSKSPVTSRAQHVTLSQCMSTGQQDSQVASLLCPHRFLKLRQLLQRLVAGGPCPLSMPGPRFYLVLSVEVRFM